MLFKPEIIIIDGVLVEGSLFIIDSIKQAPNKHCSIGFRNNLMACVIESLFVDELF